MKPWQAWGIVASLTLATVTALTLPPWPVAVLACAALVWLRRGRLAFAFFSIVTLALGAFMLALLLPGADLLAWGPLRLGREGARVGLVSSLRLVALLGMNLAMLSWISAVRILDGLHMPRRMTALLAAVLIGAHDVGRDSVRLATAMRLAGMPRGLLRMARSSAAWLTAMLVLSLRRAATRRDALLLAGFRTQPSFVPVIAVASLAAASRLIVAPLPNLKAIYFIIFVGGLLFGARVGVVAALAAMAVTDIILTGLLPNAFVNLPAMAALGALGGLLGRIDFTGHNRVDRVSGALMAGAIGVGAVFLFSVLADITDWLVLPELRNAGMAGLQARILSGFVFNVVPAAANGVLFAFAVGPVQKAMRNLGWARAVPRHGTIPPPSQAPGA